MPAADIANVFTGDEYENLLCEEEEKKYKIIKSIYNHYKIFRLNKKTSSGIKFTHTISSKKNNLISIDSNIDFSNKDFLNELYKNYPDNKLSSILGDKFNKPQEKNDN